MLEIADNEKWAMTLAFNGAEVQQHFPSDMSQFEQEGKYKLHRKYITLHPNDNPSLTVEVSTRNGEMYITMKLKDLELATASRTHAWADFVIGKENQ